MLFTTKMGKEKKGFLRRGIITAPYSYPSIEGSRINMSWKLVIGGAAAYPSGSSPLHYLPPFPSNRIIVACARMNLQNWSSFYLSFSIVSTHPCAVWC